ncbi:MAG: hypothetical protein ACTHMM_16675 [Agriterribacter sp.]
MSAAKKEDGPITYGFSESFWQLCKTDALAHAVFCSLKQGQDPKRIIEELVFHNKALKDDLCKMIEMSGMQPRNYRPVMIDGVLGLPKLVIRKQQKPNEP